jgi:hypothetical protein
VDTGTGTGTVLVPVPVPYQYMYRTVNHCTVDLPRGTGMVVPVLVLPVVQINGITVPVRITGTIQY